MKYLIILFTSLLSYGEYPEKFIVTDPEYKQEAKLPEGWSKPSNYFKVTKKKIPAYRGAFTGGSSSTMTFMRLFRHIKKQDIPMTSPVEMGIKDEGDSTKMEYMSFMYRDEEVSDSSNEKKITVKDVPTTSVLSFVWQGCDCKDRKKAAKNALLSYAKSNGLELSHFRILAYNGPSVPDEEKTHEMIADYKKL